MNKQYLSRIPDLKVLAKTLSDFSNENLPVEQTYKLKVLQLVEENNVCGSLLMMLKNGDAGSHQGTKICLRMAFNHGKINIFEYTFLLNYFYQFHNYAS